jgi:4-amino-4-deoxy-L-arabinose transferase-like glycosyltransferase
VFAGCGALYFLTRINAAPGLMRAGVTVHIQFALLCLGVGLLAWGLAGWRLKRPRVDRQEILAVLAVTLLAFAIRIWALDSAVSIPLSDEYTFAQTALNIQVDNRYPLLHPFDAGYAFPWLYPYLISGSLSIFGSTVASLRLPSAVFGTLTIPALYLLGKHLFDRRIALLSALLLATFPPHVHLSRLALNNIADPLFGVLALGLLARGMKSKRRSDFALAGLSLGLTNYFYEGGRLVFIPLAVVWLLTNILPERKFEPRQLAAGITGVLALALPIYITLAAIGYSPTARLDMVAPGQERFQAIAENTVPRNILSASYLERLAGVLLFFVHTVDNSPEFFGGQQAMILPTVVPFFLLGLAYALLNWRRPAIRLLLLWFGGMVLGLGLIRIGAWTARYVPAFPLIALLMALAIHYVVAPIAPVRYRPKVALGLALVIGVMQVVYYFGPHMEFYNRQARSWRDYADAYHRAIEYPADTVVVFVTDDIVWTPYIDILKDLWKKDLAIAYFPYLEFTRETLALMDHETSYLFFVNREDSATPAMIRREFDIKGPYFSPYNVPDDKEYALYFAPVSPPA